MIDVLLAGNAIAARTIYGYIVDDIRYNVLGCVVDDEYVNSGLVVGLKSFAISDICNYYNPDKCSVVMAVGYSKLNMVRYSLYNKIKYLGYRFETYIHPSVVINTGNIGEGTTILAGSLIEPGVRIGVNCLICGKVTISHDTHIGNHCWISPAVSIAGGVQIGDFSFLGIHSSISNNVSVGESCIIGANAFINKNIDADTVCLGCFAERHHMSAQEYAREYDVL